MDLATIIAIASLVLSAASIIWIGGFKFSTVLHEVKNLGVRIDKLGERMEIRFEEIEQRFEKPENRMDNFQVELHKHDIRINTLEQK